MPLTALSLIAKDKEKIINPVVILVAGMFNQGKLKAQSYQHL